MLKKTSTCDAIKDDCNRGHELIENLFKNMERSNFPLKELLDGESKLSTFVNATLQQSLESLFSGLKGPRIAVQQWASKNMPALYGYFGSLHNYVQGKFLDLTILRSSINVLLLRVHFITKSLLIKIIHATMMI